MMMRLGGERGKDGTGGVGGGRWVISWGVASTYSMGWPLARAGKKAECGGGGGGRGGLKLCCAALCAGVACRYCMCPSQARSAAPGSAAASTLTAGGWALAGRRSSSSVPRRCHSARGWVGLGWACTRSHCQKEHADGLLFRSKE